MNSYLRRFLDHLQLLYADDEILHMRLNVLQSVMTESSLHMYCNGLALLTVKQLTDICDVCSAIVLKISQSIDVLLCFVHTMQRQQLLMMNVPIFYLHPKISNARLRLSGEGLPKSSARFVWVPL